MRPFRIPFAAFSLLCATLLGGCGDVDYQRYRTDLKTGDEVPLYEWPDSAYLANIDAMLAAEVLTDEARKADVAITIRPGRKIEPPKGIGHAGIKGMDAEEIARMRSPAPKAASPVRNDAPAPAAARPKPRARFAEEFMAALEKMAADPRAKGVSQGVTALPGEQLKHLLVRQYGTDANRLPLGVVEYQLKLLNPGVDFGNLAPGESILLPRL